MVRRAPLLTLRSTFATFDRVLRGRTLSIQQARIIYHVCLGAPSPPGRSHRGESENLLATRNVFLLERGPSYVIPRCLQSTQCPHRYPNKSCVHQTIAICNITTIHTAMSNSPDERNISQEFWRVFEYALSIHAHLRQLIPWSTYRVELHALSDVDIATWKIALDRSLNRMRRSGFVAIQVCLDVKAIDISWPRHLPRYRTALTFMLEHVRHGGLGYQEWHDWGEFVGFWYPKMYRYVDLRSCTPAARSVWEEQIRSGVERVCIYHRPRLCYKSTDYGCELMWATDASTCYERITTTLLSKVGNRGLEQTMDKERVWMPRLESRGDEEATSGFNHGDRGNVSTC